MKARTAILAILGLGLCYGVWKHLNRPEPVSVRPLILGHAGMGVRSTFPMNSWPSIEEAMTMGVDGVELDVRFTADHVPIAFHDAKLDKNTACSGEIREKDWSELGDCKCETWLRQTSILRITDILGASLANGTVFSFDMKLNGDETSDELRNHASIMNELVQGFSQYHFLIESQNLEFLGEFHSSNINAKLFYYGSDADSTVSRALRHGIPGISMDFKFITGEQISAAKSAGLEVMLWGTGSVITNREVLRTQADIVQTDDIPAMMRLLARDGSTSPK